MVDSNVPLNYDTIELAFILKSIGFQIKSFEVSKSEKAECKDIEVDIFCNASGFKTKFVLTSDKCTCPSKPGENNNSLWEIQGRGPCTPEKCKSLVHDTSCTVLPAITKKTASLGRSTLIMLLQHYQNDLLKDEQSNITINLNVSPGQPNGTNNSLNGNSSSPLNKKEVDAIDEHLSVSLNSIESIPRDSTKNAEQNNLPKIFVQDSNEHEPVEVQNLPSSSRPQHNGITSPCIIRQSPDLDQMNIDNERDIYVIESITKARKELDYVLLLLKCNVTRDLSDTSLLTTTPRTVKNKPIPIKGLAEDDAALITTKPAKRRASLGSSGEVITNNDMKVLAHFTKPLPKAGSLATNAKLKTLVKNKTLHSDSPRPAVDLKQIVEKGIAKSKLLRTGSSTNLKVPAPSKIQATKIKPIINKKKL